MSDVSGEQARAIEAKLSRRVDEAKLAADVMSRFEDCIVRWSQEDLPMPAYMRAEELVMVLTEMGVLGPSVLERGQGLNVQEAGQAASDRRPPFGFGEA